ncbi:lipoprotein [Mycoplasmoides pneumoniae]
MRKKRLLSRISFSSLFLLCGTLLSACTGIQADLRNLIKETTGKDIDLSKAIKTKEGKKNIIASLKKSYEVNPRDTTKLLLDAWKQSFEEGKLGIPDFDFDDVIYPASKDPFTMERKIEHFQMTYQSFKDLSVEAKLSYTFNWFGDYSSGGFTAKKGDKHYFDLFLKIKPDAKKSFTIANFKTEEDNSTTIGGKETTRNLEWIEFSASLKFSLKGKDDVSQKSVNKFLSTFANNTEGYSSNINLFIYLEYLIK